MNVEELKKLPVFAQFYEICQIPHGSGNERKLSEYLCSRAQQAGYEAVRDTENNVLIKAPASEGYDDAPVVMLQAHMDMVCEKNADSVHDFSRDPIPWVTEGDFLTTGGETTLGADNGIGVALAMALLDDKEYKGPRLEVLFTTNEEEDFSGASAFAAENMTAGYLINLDHVREDETVCGSCGGMRVDMRIPMDMKPVPAGSVFYRIAIYGLKGGHSGDDIHLGRGSANAFMGRVLRRLKKAGEYQIIKITGGTFRLAIPREAEAVIAVEKEMAACIPDILRELEAQFRSELPISGSSLHIDAEELSAAETFTEGVHSITESTHSIVEDTGSILDGGNPVTECTDSIIEGDDPTKENAGFGIEGADPVKVITAIALTPDGICQMNEAFTGIVDTSDNLGEIYLDKDMLHFVLEIRSAAESLREELFERMKLAAGILGGEASCSDAYPSWRFQAGSPLQNLCGKVYKELRGREMRFMTVHAGLETGYFLEKKPDIDAVSIGPDIYDFHSPSERVSIPSTLRVYEYLKLLLREI